MDQSIRFCTQKGLQNSFSQNICTHPNCDQYQRLVCGECMAYDIHMHKEASNKHLLNLNKFHEKYSQEIITMKDNQEERKNTYLHMLGDLKELIQEFQEKTKDVINMIKEFETTFISDDDKNNQMCSCKYWNKRMFHYIITNPSINTQYQKLLVQQRKILETHRITKSSIGGGLVTIIIE